MTVRRVGGLTVVATNLKSYDWHVVRDGGIEFNDAPRACHQIPRQEEDQHVAFHHNVTQLPKVSEVVAVEEDWGAELL